MKKLLAIAVVFALISGVAFAETQVSGSIGASLYLMDLNFSTMKEREALKDNPALTSKDRRKEITKNDTTHGGLEAFIQISGENDEGTIGGLFRLRNHDITNDSGVVWGDAESWEDGIPVMNGTYDPDTGAFMPGTGYTKKKATAKSGAWFHRAFVWWKPIPQIRVFLGIDNDGMFDTAGMTGWAFHKGSNAYIFNHHWDFWRQIFPGNWDGFGLALSFYPADVFEINLVIPVGALGWPQATKGSVETERKLGDIYPWGLRLMGAVKLDFGQIQFTYNLGDKDANADMGYRSEFANNKNHWGRFGLSANITAIDGVTLLVGGSIVIPEYKLTDADSDYYGAIIGAGLGFEYSGAEKFGIKARVGYKHNMLNKSKNEARKEANKTASADDKKKLNGSGILSANLLPYFNVGPGQLIVDLGITVDVTEGNLDAWKNFNGDNKDNKPHFVGWQIIPMYRLPLGAGSFEIGLQLYRRMKMGGNQASSPKDNDNHLHLGVPMALTFNF